MLPGALLAVLGLRNPPPSVDTRVFLYLPPVAGAMGAVVGVGFACACAPTRFLNGPLGARWLRLIGTRNVPMARAIGVVLSVVVAGVPLLFLWLAASR